MATKRRARSTCPKFEKLEWRISCSAQAASDLDSPADPLEGTLAHAMGNYFAGKGPDTKMLGESTLIDAHKRHEVHGVTGPNPATGSESEFEEE